MATKKKQARRGPASDQARKPAEAAQIVADQAGVLEWPPILTVKEAAQVLRVSASLIYKLAESGELPCLHVGRAVRFSRAQLVGYLSRNEKPPADQDGGRIDGSAERPERASRQRGKAGRDWRKRYGLS